ncbi:4-hydroxybenzoate octaprenyltransferase [Aspergillus brunneoviolaceus CBS 621.78]|uniref:UbiA prenyltransferase n=1 Tax=Aspergillus brunneoviolaceus CBS 621.78 TaxID=1450534 RepID=A0ACD1FSK3_9EURO|nr:UbiA prenyltransferase [Aspergillus brunneoviolaceus CBS 621.78]RAH39939.1 UbiA prenyltransferase [Aspergillus brunneoviolaceus CBS 621.78]
MPVSTKASNGSTPPTPIPKGPPAPRAQDQPLSLTNPASWIPYLQLMRLDRPAGFIGFYMPSILGLVYAASLAGPETVPLRRLLTQGIFWLGANILIRGAACTWNDNIDQEYDRQVDRCRGRPIARGAVSTQQAHVFLALQLALLGRLFQPLLSFSSSSSSTQTPSAYAAYAAAAMGSLYALYPFCKRFTHYPQAILGVPLALAIVLSAYSLVGAGDDARREGDPFRDRPTTAATLALALAEILWTMIYDTVYAHQDLQDDLRAGVKSMAVRFRHSTKPLCAALGVGQVALLACAGAWTHMPPVYFVVGVAGSAVALVVMLVSVDLAVPASCARWFKLGFCFVGGCMNCGFFAAYLVRWFGWA